MAQWMGYHSVSILGSAFYCHFEPWANMVIPHCSSSLSCTNGYLAIDSSCSMMGLCKARILYIQLSLADAARCDYTPQRKLI